MGTQLTTMPAIRHRLSPQCDEAEMFMARYLAESKGTKESMQDDIERMRRGEPPKSGLAASQSAVLADAQRRRGDFYSQSAVCTTKMGARSGSAADAHSEAGAMTRLLNWKGEPRGTAATGRDFTERNALNEQWLANAPANLSPYGGTYEE